MKSRESQLPEVQNSSVTTPIKETLNVTDSTIKSEGESKYVNRIAASIKSLLADKSALEENIETLELVYKDLQHDYNSFSEKVDNLKKELSASDFVKSELTKEQAELTEAQELKVKIQQEIADMKSTANNEIELAKNNADKSLQDILGAVYEVNQEKELLVSDIAKLNIEKEDLIIKNQSAQLDLLTIQNDIKIQNEYFVDLKKEHVETIAEFSQEKVNLIEDKKDLIKELNAFKVATSKAAVKFNKINSELKEFDLAKKEFELNKIDYSVQLKDIELSKKELADEKINFNKEKEAFASQKEEFAFLQEKFDLKAERLDIAKKQFELKIDNNLLESKNLKIAVTKLETINEDLNNQIHDLENPIKFDLNNLFGNDPMITESIALVGQDLYDGMAFSS